MMIHCAHDDFLWSVDILKVRLSAVMNLASGLVIVLHLLLTQHHCGHQNGREHNMLHQ